MIRWTDLLHELAKHATSDELFERQVEELEFIEELGPFPAWNLFLENGKIKDKLEDGAT